MEAWDSVAEFNMANLLPKKGVGEPVGWCADRKDKELVVIHVDAGCFKEGLVAFGCMIRSRDSKVIYVACRRDFKSTDPALDELLAISWCVEIAKDLNFNKIMVQSDTMPVVDCIIALNFVVAVDLIAGDVRDVCNSFKYCSVMYLNRTFISDAYNLVKWGKSLGARSQTIDPPAI